MLLGRNYDPAIFNGGKWLLSDILGGGFSVLNNTWYVSSSQGLDTNGGAQNAPFKTIGKAVSVASANDTIVVGAGSYSEAVVVPSTLTGLSILGVGTVPHSASWTSGTDTTSLTIQASNVEVAGFYFKPPVQSAGSPASIVLSNAAYAYIHDNRFQGQTGSYYAIYSPVCNSDNVIIADNDFEYLNTASYGSGILGIDAGTSEYSDWQILRNKFSSCVTAVSLAGRVCLVQGNHFAQEGVNAAGTIASVTTTKLSLYGTTGSGTGANLVHGNYFGGTYSAAGGYIVGSTVDDWAGNYVIAGITTANPS